LQLLAAFHIYTVEEITEINSVEISPNLSLRNFQKIDLAKKKQYVTQLRTYVIQD